MDAKDIVYKLEENAELPAGNEERFAGYGVMGLPFVTGHILGMRRFMASSVGPGYTSVWQRNPGGQWTFFQDEPPEKSCHRYFGSALSEIVGSNIKIEWLSSDDFTVAIESNHHLNI